MVPLLLVAFGDFVGDGVAVVFAGVVVVVVVLWSSVFLSLFWKKSLIIGCFFPVAVRFAACFSASVIGVVGWSRFSDLVAGVMGVPA